MIIVNQKLVLPLFGLVALLSAPLPLWAQSRSSIISSYDKVGSHVVVLKNQSELIPLKDLDHWHPVLVTIGSSSTQLSALINKYRFTEVVGFKRLEDQTWPTGTNLFILEIDLNQSPSSTLIGVSNKLDQIGLPYIVVFLKGRPSSLQPGLFSKAQSILYSWGESEYIPARIAEILFGASAANGTLTFYVNKEYRMGSGIQTKSLNRLRYGPPELVGLDGQAFNTALSLAMDEAISNKIFPGANLLVAKDGVVIFHKAFGKTTYTSTEPLSKDAIYDLASITKIFGATLGSMNLHSKGLFNTETVLSTYLTDFKRSNKGRLKWRDILAHQARLPATITFYKNVVSSKGTFKSRTVQPGIGAAYPYPVSDILYAHKRIPSKLLNDIKRAPLLAKSGYVYSDLSMILLFKSIEKITKIPFDQFMDQTIYSPLGADHTLFLPLRSFSKNEVVPTERDSFFRHTLVHGFVHDENAALLGGISGHAGLFSTANDMAKIAQMLLNKGSYGGKQYMTPQTVELFTSYQYPQLNNRRGLGWDKPLLKFDLDASPVARDVSPQSYGHSGFTGTFVWIDPTYQLTYILLTNRVYPSRANNKISQYSIRPCIQQTIYDFILQDKNKLPKK